LPTHKPSGSAIRLNAQQTSSNSKGNVLWQILFGWVFSGILKSSSLSVVTKNNTVVRRLKLENLIVTRCEIKLIPVLNALNQKSNKIMH